MLSHTHMGVPYEYTHMGRPIRIWTNIHIWGRTWLSHLTYHTESDSWAGKNCCVSVNSLICTPDRYGKSP